MFTSFNDVRMNNMKRIYEKYAVHSLSKSKFT